MYIVPHIRNHIVGVCCWISPPLPEGNDGEAIAGAQHFALAPETSWELKNAVRGRATTLILYYVIKYLSFAERYINL